MSGSRAKRFLVLIDDGWRHEKKDILIGLREWIDLEIVTHDEMTEEAFTGHLPVTRIPVKPLSRNLGASLVMFFARDLQTNLVQYRKRIRFRAMSAPMKILHGLRELAGRLGLRRYSYTQALEWLYRDSHEYDEVLEGFDFLLYMPVSVQDKRVICEARKAGLDVVTWIYSWDNPMKDNEFFADAARYLVWNEPNRSDLEEYQGISPDRVDVVGPAQFDYLHEVDFRTAEPAPEPYVLFACAFGQTYHLEQEVDMILEVRRILDRIRPDMKLCVRPYPFRFKIDGYRRLEDAPGIELLNFGRIEGDRVVIDEEVMRERVLQIHRAECLINPGSTIGLEGAFTETPILQLNFSLPSRFPDYQSTRWVYRNEHLKYIIVPGYPNVLTSLQELEARLRDVLEGRVEPFRPYSRQLRDFSTPMGMIPYRDVLGRVLKGIADDHGSGC